MISFRCQQEQQRPLYVTGFFIAGQRVHAASSRLERDLLSSFFSETDSKVAAGSHAVDLDAVGSAARQVVASVNTDKKVFPNPIICASAKHDSRNQHRNGF